MKRPSPAILGSILLHAGLLSLAFIAWPKKADETTPMTSAVPVAIVSSTVIEAAVPDNPSDEPVTQDAATAPVEAPPEPQPQPRPTPPPTPSRPVLSPPVLRPPTRPVPPAPTTRPAPSRPTPAPPTPARPRPTPSTPARPSTPRSQPSLDLNALAGPRRPSSNTGTRAPTGQQGAGRASQATGPQLTAIFNQVYPNWTLPCDIPGADQLRIRISVTLGPDGRVTAGPTLLDAQSGPVYRAAADGALRAIRQTAPFDVPAGFPGGPFTTTFNTERACRNR